MDACVPSDLTSQAYSNYIGTGTCAKYQFSLTTYEVNCRTCGSGEILQETSTPNKFQCTTLSSLSGKIDTGVDDKCGQLDTVDPKQNECKLNDDFQGL